MYLSKSRRFRIQKCDRLIFDENHEGYLILFRQILMIPKKLSKGVRKLVLIESNCWVLFWLPEMAFDTRKRGPNA